MRRVSADMRPCRTPRQPFTPCSRIPCRCAECTFIVFHRASLEAAEASGGDITAAMCGDVNLFLLDDDASEDYAPQAVEAGAGAAAQVPKAAEVMVMIAEPDHRQKGYAREAVLALMSYGQSALGLKRFVAKITDTNAASIRLFQKLGFREAKRLAVFSEVHFALDVEPGMLPADVAARVAAYDNPEV